MFSESCGGGGYNRYHDGVVSDSDDSGESFGNSDRTKTAPAFPMPPNAMHHQQPQGLPVMHHQQPQHHRHESSRFHPYDWPQAPYPPSQNYGNPWYERTNTQIQTLANSQKTMMNMVEKVCDRLDSIENVVMSLKSNSPSSSGGSPQEKSRIPSLLSKRVAMIHEALEEDKQFRPQLGAKDDFNKGVKKCIEDEVSLAEGDSYSKILIERAIQRYFESRRRSWREQTDPSQQERVLKQAKCRRIRSRRRRLFDRRIKTLRDDQEKQKFGELTLEFMSEESSSNELQMVVHKPEWRSDKLEKFLTELDKRVEDMNKENKKHVPERKERVCGSLAAVSPPTGAPKWTISREWLKAHPDFTQRKEQ